MTFTEEQAVRTMARNHAMEMVGIVEQAVKDADSRIYAQSYWDTLVKEFLAIEEFMRRVDIAHEEFL